MRRLRAFLARLTGLASRSRDERDLAEELTAHVRLHIDDNLRSGMTFEEARRDALLKLGGIAHTADRWRDERRLPLLETTMQDVRYAVRTLRRSPVFAVVATVTLALGIGANTAIFSVIDGVLLRPAPFTDMAKLAVVWETDRASGTTREPASVPDYDDFRARSRQFAKLTAAAPTELNLTSATGEPRRIAGLSIAPDFLQVLGIAPLAGRAFAADEYAAGRAGVVVISDALWAELFTRDPAALGRSIRLDDVERTIVGVMPRDGDFGTLQLLNRAAYGRGFAERGDRTRVDAWIPLVATVAMRRESHGVFVIGRLAEAATAGSAQQEMTELAADLEQDFPQSNASRGVFVESLGNVIFAPVRPALYLLITAVALVFLVACANVANLLLVRASERVREVTVRAALGAGYGRLTRQFFVEGVVMALAGALLGVGVAWIGVGVLKALAPAALPRVDLVRVDARVLVAAFVLSIAVALVFGALPMVHLRRQDLVSGLRGIVGVAREGGRGLARLRSAIVAGQLALTTMLMVSAGLLVKSLWNIRNVDPGFSAAGVLKAEFQLPAPRYPQDFAKFPVWPERSRFFEELRSRLANVPGVREVALAAANPLDAGFTSSIRVVGREAEGRNWPEPSIRAVSDSYFRTMHARVAAGRPFDSSDTARSNPVALINEAANRRFFDRRPAIGQRVRLWGSSREIVGIVADEHFKGLAHNAPPAVYLPLTQAPLANAVMVRTELDPRLLAADIRRVIREIDPLLPLFGVEPLTETLTNSQAERRFTMVLLISFAGLALILAVVGVHGVLSYTVAQRAREIGIRVALGADLARIRSMVLLQALTLAAIGIASGLAAAGALTGYLRTLLFDVSARDPLMFAGVAIVLSAVSLTASWVPARRAMRLDPIVVLRQE